MICVMYRAVALYLVMLSSFLLLPLNGFAQPYYLSLEEVVDLAGRQSPDAMMARHRYRGSYWAHRSYRAAYLPLLELNATLPNLNRTISPIIQPDGSELFMRRSLATSSGTLSLSQRVGPTGGQFFITSGLQRIDLIRDDQTQVSYLSTPVNIGFRQPIFAFNPFRWERQIEPLRYQEARRQYLVDMENVNIRATNMFFDLLLAQINMEINAINLANNDTLYKIAEGRYSLGRIAENELLQMELNLLNSDANLEQSRIDYEAALFRFRSFLGLDSRQELELIPPAHTHELRVDVSMAMAEARRNRPDNIARQRQIIDAESQVARALSESRFNVNMYAVFGLTQTATELGAVYRDPLDQQQLTIGISIPILDWGVGRGRVRVAQSNRELVQTTVSQGEIDFEQEVMLKVMEFNMLASQLEIARKADIIAQRRYEVTRQRFMIGRIDIIELNLALEDKDRATQRYLGALRTYWREYYVMRRLTLFDFLNNKPLTVNYDEI